MLRRYGKFRVLTYVIYLLFLFIDFFLVVYKVLSFDQFYMYLFGLMGTYVVIDSLLKAKKDSLLKRHQMLFTVSIVLTIVLLTTFLITSSINSAFSVIIIAGFALSIALFFQTMEWNNKRKTKQNPSLETPSPP